MRPGFCLLLLCASVTAYPQTRQDAPPSDRERMLLDRIDKLEARIAALEARSASKPAAPAQIPAPVAAATVQPQEQPPSTQPVAQAPGAKSPLSFSDGTTLNFYLDGYYAYNFNHPAGRINLLRSNDALSNNFSLSQTGIVIERAPDAAANHRFGYRLDLMFGLTTDAQQGSVLNEPRPQVYRHIFQAYGSYIMPLGKGLRLDFGKFSNSFGLEGNWVKDQMNYSRSYLFNALPFYHAGLRASYTFNDKLSVQYWLVNGENQTEDFNNYKSQAVLLSYNPTKNVGWNLNYYQGQEQRDVLPVGPDVFPVLPTQPGLSADKVNGPYNGRLHIIDSNATFHLGPAWTAAFAGDYFLNRVTSNAPPVKAYGGAAYLHRQLNQQLALNGRFEYLADRGGFFSGTGQDLKEATLTAVYQPVNGFQAKLEYRRDFTNVPFFLTGNPALLKRSQTTATLGLLWSFGGKDEAW